MLNGLTSACVGTLIPKGAFAVGSTDVQDDRDALDNYEDEKRAQWVEKRSVLLPIMEKPNHPPIWRNTPYWWRTVVKPEPNYGKEHYWWLKKERGIDE